MRYEPVTQEKIGGVAAQKGKGKAEKKIAIGNRMQLSTETLGKWFIKKENVQ